MPRRQSSGLCVSEESWGVLGGHAAWYRTRHNLTENAIRPSAVGKKNWLFIGHPEAGWRSAVLYTILVSCRRRGIDTWEYLRDVFARLPSATNQQIQDFVPARWKELREAKKKPA